MLLCLLPAAICPGQEESPSVAPAVVERVPLPGAAEREKALQLVRELYKSDFESARKPAERVELALKILQQSAEVEQPAERFTLLDVARKIAAGAGGVEATLQALTQLEAQFKFDSLPARSDSLKELVRANLSLDDRKRVAQEFVRASELATENDRYDFALQLLVDAQTSLRRVRDPNLLKTLNEHVAAARQLKSDYSKVTPALDQLKSSPENVEANLTAGRFYCLSKGDWELGLPLLAKGGSKTLGALAKLDLTRPASSADQLKLADGYRAESLSATGSAQKQLEYRAAHWYRVALPNLNGLEKSRVEKALGEMKHAVAAAGPKQVFLPQIPLLGVQGVLINDGKPHFREERLRGEKYPQVLWAHPQDKAPSHYAFNLSRKYTQLSGKAAINDIQSVERALRPQVFAIYGDNRLLWKSKPLQQRRQSEAFEVSVRNVRTLHLWVSGGGYGAHALWVDLALEEK